MYSEKNSSNYWRYRQDGSYLAEFLLNKNYEVHGIKRRSSSLNTTRIDLFTKILQKLKEILFFIMAI